MSSDKLDQPYFYHVTGIERVEAILAEGLQPQSTHRDALEGDLATVAADHGVALPIDRRDCVFLYPTLVAATRTLPSLDAEPGPLRDREAIVVVDWRPLEADLYVGEFDLISDAIDFQHIDEPDAAMSAASYEDALARYAATLESLAAFDTIDQLTSAYDTPEIVVDSQVPPAHIVEWRLHKRIRADRGPAG